MFFAIIIYCIEILKRKWNMNTKNKKVSDFISEAYRNLPLKLRVKVNTTAIEFLEIQRKNKALVEEAGKLSSYEDGDGGII
jgi:hypothetical protein